MSAQLVRLHDTLCVEDLNLKGLVRTKTGEEFQRRGYQCVSEDVGIQGGASV